MPNKLLIFVCSFIFIFCINQFSYAVTFEEKRHSESEKFEYKAVFKNTNIDKVYDELIFNTDNVVQGELVVDSKGRSIWNKTILLEDVTDYKSACKLMEHNKHGIAYYESLPSEQYEYAVETVAREGTIYFFKAINLIYYYAYMEPQAGIVDNISIKDEVFTVTVNQLSTILYNIDENTIKNSKDFEKSGNLHTHTIKFINDKQLLFDGSIRYYCQE